MRPGHRRDCRKPFGQRHHMLVIKIGAGDVDQLGGLFLYGGDYFGMAMSSRNHRNAGGEVEKLVSVYIFYAHPAAALGHHGIGTGIAGGDVAIITLNNRARFRTRYRAQEFWAVLGKNSAVLYDRCFASGFSAFSEVLKASQTTATYEYRAVRVRAELRRREASRRRRD